MMTAANKTLLALAIVAAAAIGWYAWRILPGYFSTAAPNSEQNIVRVDPSDQIRGPSDAPKTIIEFGDLECPTCAALDPQLANLVAQTSDLRLAWKDCPSSSHPNAEAAAEAAQCAGDQHQYWAYHDLLIQNQDTLGPDLYPRLAAQLKLNAATFALCLKNGEKNAQVAASINECVNVGVTELPGLYVNGKLFSGADANIIHELTTELNK